MTPKERKQIKEDHGPSCFFLEQKKLVEVFRFHSEHYALAKYAI